MKPAAAKLATAKLATAKPCLARSTTRFSCAVALAAALVNVACSSGGTDGSVQAAPSSNGIEQVNAPGSETAPSVQGQPSTEPNEVVVGSSPLPVAMDPSVGVAPPVPGNVAPAGMVPSGPQDPSPEAPAPANALPDPGFSPLAQLTNDEFVLALADLLGLTKQQVEDIPARAGLAPDPNSSGLASASNRQAITQLAMTGYATLSSEAASVFLGNVIPREYRERLDCDALAQKAGVQDAANYTSEQCTRDYGENLMRRGYRGSFDDGDAARLDAVMVGIDEILATEGPAVAAGANARQRTMASLALRFSAVVQLAVLSPKFLFLLERGEPNPVAPGQLLSEREIANRMAFFLSGGPPSEALLQAAADGKLRSTDGRSAAADALLATPQAAAGAVNILLGWLGIDERADGASIQVLRTFLNDWIAADRPFEDLYAAPFPVEHLDGTVTQEAFGVLGSQALLASHTSPPTASFINRGEFVTERLLCAVLPDDIPDAALEGDPKTPRDVFFVHATDPCASCHRVFDNYGAALEKFDLDTSLYNPGAETLADNYALFPLGDVDATVSNPGELGAVIGASLRAKDCMARLWYRHAVRRDLLSDSQEFERVSQLVGKWSAGGSTSLRSLLRTIVAESEFIRILP